MPGDGRGSVALDEPTTAEPEQTGLVAGGRRMGTARPPAMIAGAAIAVALPAAGLGELSALGQTADVAAVAHGLGCAALGMYAAAIIALVGDWIGLFDRWVPRGPLPLTDSEIGRCMTLCFCYYVLGLGVYGVAMSMVLLLAVLPSTWLTVSAVAGVSLWLLAMGVSSHLPMYWADRRIRVSSGSSYGR